MNKRQLVRRRKTARKAFFLAALLTTLTIETLMVAACSRDLLRPLQQDVSIDIGRCFRGY